MPLTSTIAGKNGIKFSKTGILNNNRWSRLGRVWLTDLFFPQATAKNIRNIKPL
jgi:hypothetical protein